MVDSGLPERMKSPESAAPTQTRRPIRPGVPPAPSRLEPGSRTAAPEDVRRPEDLQGYEESGRVAPEDGAFRLYFASLSFLARLAALPRLVPPPYLASLLCLAAATGCAARTPRSYRLVPSPAPAYSIEDGTVSIKSERFHLSVMPLDDMARAAFIRARASGAMDPFAYGGDGGSPRYLTFRLSVENLGGKEPIVFQPQNIFLASESGDRMYPLDYPEAYRRLVASPNSDPRFLDDLSRYLFDVGVSVPPGARVEGLLVYPTLKSQARRLRMEFNFLQTGGSSSTNYDIFFVKEPLS